MLVLLADMEFGSVQKFRFSDPDSVKLWQILEPLTFYNCWKKKFAAPSGGGREIRDFVGFMTQISDFYSSCSSSSFRHL